jgi:integrase
MLTDTRIRQQKTPGKISDGGGLFLLVTPTGTKLWRQAYRFGGKQKGLAHGAYPEVSLQEARSLREGAKALLRKGIDPSAHRQIAKHSLNGATTFQAVAEEWLTKLEREGLTEATLTKSRWLLGFAYPDIGARPVGEITPPELLTALRRVEGRGRYESARRLRAICGSVFRYAIATGRSERDPAADLRGALTVQKTRHHAAITEPKKIGGLLRAIDGYDGRHPATRLALQLMALTFVRSSELRYAEWTEIDMDKAVWVIPAARMKMKTEHRVPLSRQAIAVIEALRPITGERRWLLPSLHLPTQRPMSENTLNGALRRLGYGPDEIVIHGFRGMASTCLNELGFAPDVIERQLAHQDRNAVRRSYNRAEHWPERVAMMQAWADYLDGLRDSR